MSIFSKPISRLATQDLAELLTETAVENVRLEFKLDVPGKDETLKKLSSFANTFGGFLLVGAKASSVDGRLQGFPGVELQDGYKQKVVQWSYDGASPPFTVEVSDPIPAPGAPDRFCYVIYTAESDLTPHFLNGRKGVYVRTDEFSARFEARLANESEIRRLLDRRKLIRERRVGLVARARKRFATFARRRYAKLAAAGKTDSKELGGRLEVCVCPRFPALPVCRQDDLAPLLRANCLSWRQVGFPRLSNGIISQHESAIILQRSENFSIIEANIWGMLFYGTEIGTETRTAAGVHLHQFIGSVLVFLRHAGRFLQALGYSGPVLIEAALASILGVNWLHFPYGNVASPMPGSELDDDVEFAVATTSEELRERPDTVASDVLREVFFSVNLPQLVDTPERLRSLILEGYDYNFWQKPTDC